MLLSLVLVLAATSPLAAQDQPAQPQSFPRVDSITVEGNARLSSEQIATAAGIVLGTEVTFRDVQRSIRSLFATGQFDSVRVEQRTADGKVVLVFVVAERPILRGWDLTGPRAIPAREVRDRVTLVSGRPLDRAALAKSAFAIDSMYRNAGYYGVQVSTTTDEVEDGVHVTFDVREGNRIVISQVLVDGNAHYSDQDVVGRDCVEAGGISLVPQRQVRRRPDRRGHPVPVAGVVR